MFGLLQPSKSNKSNKRHYPDQMIRNSPPPSTSHPLNHPSLAIFQQQRPSSSKSISHLDSQPPHQLPHSEISPASPNLITPSSLRPTSPRVSGGSLNGRISLLDDYRQPQTTDLSKGRLSSSIPESPEPGNTSFRLPEKQREFSDERSLQSIEQVTEGGHRSYLATAFPDTEWLRSLVPGRHASQQESKLSALTPSTTDLIWNSRLSSSSYSTPSYMTQPVIQSRSRPSTMESNSSYFFAARPSSSSSARPATPSSRAFRHPAQDLFSGTQWERNPYPQPQNHYPPHIPPSHGQTRSGYGQPSSSEWTSTRPTSSQLPNPHKVHPPPYQPPSTSSDQPSAPSEPLSTHSSSPMKSGIKAIAESGKFHSSTSSSDSARPQPSARRQGPRGPTRTRPPPLAPRKGEFVFIDESENARQRVEAEARFAQRDAQRMLRLGNRNVRDIVTRAVRDEEEVDIAAAQLIISMSQPQHHPMMGSSSRSGGASRYFEALGEVGVGSGGESSGSESEDEPSEIDGEECSEGDDDDSEIVEMDDDDGEYNPKKGFKASHFTRSRSRSKRPSNSRTLPLSRPQSHPRHTSRFRPQLITPLHAQPSSSKGHQTPHYTSPSPPLVDISTESTRPPKRAKLTSTGLGDDLQRRQEGTDTHQDGESQPSQMNTNMDSAPKRSGRRDLNKRKQQNKVAQKKFREKKKAVAQQMKRELTSQKEVNDRLEMLRWEKEEELAEKEKAMAKLVEENEALKKRLERVVGGEGEK